MLAGKGGVRREIQRRSRKAWTLQKLKGRFMEGIFGERVGPEVKRVFWVVHSEEGLGCGLRDLRDLERIRRERRRGIL